MTRPQVSQPSLPDQRAAGKFLLSYGLTVVLPGIVVIGLLLLSSQHAEAGGSTSSHVDVAARQLLAVGVVVLACLCVGKLVELLGQPKVIGEILAGILLGPSLLGWLWPSASDALFAPNQRGTISALSQVGLTVFMFVVGAEFDINAIRGRRKTVVAVGHAGIAVPFTFAVALSFLLYPTFAGSGVGFLGFALFLGAALSMTAFPVLARIVRDRGMSGSKLAVLAISTAAVVDVTGWCLLALVLAIIRHGPAHALVTIGATVLFCVLVIVVVRPLVTAMFAAGERGQLSDSALLSVVLILTLACSIATDLIGIQTIFGAFLFGAILPKDSPGVHRLVGQVESFAIVLLLPMFFAQVGLDTKVGLLGVNPVLWLICLLILVVAVLGKFGGSAVAARACGLSWHESSALAVLMNCRGLTELVVLKVGLDFGIISPTLFTMLVIMALVTTASTAPLLSLVQREPKTRALNSEA
jgi:Kef-type K+ transport system membrane component KefB